jgi:p-cumate 2,3-dioxygenase ferredoxin reductase component
LAQPVENIVIAGAGQARGRAAEALRGRGFRGAITIIGQEPHPPYERPQLSKSMLQSLDVPLVYLKHAASKWSRRFSVSAAEDTAMLRRIIAANARRSRADLESRAYDLRGGPEMAARHT